MAAAGDYIGPEGFGAVPESGGSKVDGQNRIQSMNPDKRKLTASRKAEIASFFDGYGIEIKHIDKTRYGRVRVWYNGDLHVQYK